MNTPKHILKNLINNNTSLGDNPAYPPDEENRYIVNIVEDYLSDMDVYDDTKKEVLSKVITKIKKIERNNITKLEKLCGNILYDIFNIPDNSITFDLNIVDNIDLQDQRIVPEKTVDFSFDSIDDMDFLSKEVYKRRILDAIICGASIDMSEYIKLYLEELFNINEELPVLYKKLFKLNKSMIYTEKLDLYNHSNNGGRVDVYINSGDIPVKIKAQGILFPILLEESIKGLLELAISHGLPQEIEKAEYVIKKADFRLAEIWDIRLGLPLWNVIKKRFMSNIENEDINKVGINYILMELSLYDTKEFNIIMREIFMGTKKSKTIIEDIISNIIENKGQEDFNNYVNNKNSETLDDSYFSPEELISEDNE